MNATTNPQDMAGMITTTCMVSAIIMLNVRHHRFRNAFIIGQIINTALNCVLKCGVWQQLKPIRYMYSSKPTIIELANSTRGEFQHGWVERCLNQYKMPSAYMQWLGFALVFVSLVIQSPPVTTCYLIAVIVVGWSLFLSIPPQHTLVQLLAGLLVGSIVASLVFVFTKRQIMSENKENQMSPQ